VDADIGGPLVERCVSVGGLRFHLVEGGSGPLVLLLHGFPEFWWSWRHQLPALADAGYHAVAVDLLGYNLSAKPRSVAAYRPRALARATAELIETLGHRSASVVGHDWGGGVAWFTAAYQPQSVERLVIMGAPHPLRMASWLRSFRGVRAEVHALVAQIPLLGQAAFGARHCAWLRRRFLVPAARAGAFDSSNVRRYTEALSRPGALRSALNYYRAAARAPEQALLKTVVIGCPVLLLWGRQDRFVPPHLALPDPRLVPDASLEVFDGADHWIQNERPQQVSARLIDFLRGPAVNDPSLQPLRAGKSRPSV
jgi:pimeloyl-ACP methyl ester carboxylesterase